jgi:hypothetical protein
MFNFLWYSLVYIRLAFGAASLALLLLHRCPSASGCYALPLRNYRGSSYSEGAASNPEGVGEANRSGNLPPSRLAKAKDLRIKNVILREDKE